MNTKLPLLLLFNFYCLFLIGQNCSPDSLIHRQIKAITTDSNISNELLRHQIFLNPDCPQQNKLVLHLVGSIDNPASTTFYPILAANCGFKAINLKYRNNVTAFGTCSNSSDSSCYRNFRQEIIFGEDVSLDVSVDVNNSIINRVEKLLIHLNEIYPLEGWNSFITSSNEINWSNIILSGHSQGGGHAAFIAKLFEVERVLMYASPNDFSTFFSAPASWVSNSSITPESRYFAFGNLYDEVADFSNQYAIWGNMNLLSLNDSTNVDNAPSGFNNSNILYTKNTSSSINHNDMIIDNWTPISSGVPVFAPVWKYMLGCDITSSISTLTDDFSEINVFPNPTKDEIFIESDDVIYRAEIISLSGKRLKVIHPNQKNFQLNLNNFKGLLFLRLFTKNMEAKLIKVISN